MRSRKTKTVVIPITILILMCLLLGVLFYNEHRKLNASTVQSNNYRDTLQANTLEVYVASQDIKAGDRLFTEDMIPSAEEELLNAPDEHTAGAILNREVEANVYKEEIYTSLPEEMYITSNMLGGVALVDIKAEQPIMANMTKPLELAQDTREYEISSAALMVDQKSNDVVDVRITFPNGEDYLLLAKKTIRNLSLYNSTFWTYMNEDEIMRFTSAMIDAYQTTGTRIYTVRYAADTLQETAVPNYPVRAETLDLMRTDPNMYARAEETLNAAARLSLEARLGQLTSEQLNAVNQGFGLTDTAKSSVLQEQIDNHAAEIANLMEEQNETETASGTEETAEASETEETGGSTE